MISWQLSRTLAALGVLILLLSACGTDAVKPDEAVTLEPGYGIAAVAFNSLDVLNSVVITPLDKNNPKLDLGSVDKGESLFVFVVPAGTYCLHQFHFGFYRFTQIDLRANCFDVVEGKVAYSGNYTPRGYGKSVRTAQTYDWPAFEKTFKDQYPKLAQYPIVTP